MRPTRTADAPQSFLAELHKKYVSDPDKDKEPPRQICFNSKVAEEVGFEKVRRKQAKLDELKYVILDGLRVARVYEEGAEEKPIGEVCPEIRELDLSRNLFERFGPVVEVCRELKHLKSLRAKYVSAVRSELGMMLTVTVGIASRMSRTTRSSVSQMEPLTASLSWL